MRAALIACISSLVAATGVAAQDGCGKFAWSVSRETALFADGFVADVQSETSLPRDGVFSMLLQPVSRVIYTVAPARGRDDGFGGIVTLEWVAAGRYQVTVSGDAWIDAVQNDRRLPILALSSRDDCPGIRQSVRFQIKDVPLTLQFGGAMVRRLNVAVMRVFDSYGIGNPLTDGRRP